MQDMLLLTTPYLHLWGLCRRAIKFVACSLALIVVPGKLDASTVKQSCLI